jgi:NADH-quinone oxidoreductase subunit A
MLVGSETKPFAFDFFIINPSFTTFAGMISEFGNILIFIIGGIIFVAGGLTTAFLVRPNKPNEEKNTSYECGEDPIGSAWGNFNLRFYIVALIFLLFEVEIVFLFPWATVFGNEQKIIETGGAWAWLALTEVFAFILILALGLVYAWVRGYLDWIKPNPEVPTSETNIPRSAYAAVNEKYTHGTTR